MARIAAHVLIGTLLLCWVILAGADPDSQTMQEATVRVICKLPTGYAAGSGFLVGGSRLHVVTNAHVVSQCVEPPFILTSDKLNNEPRKSLSKTIWTSLEGRNNARLDLAILELQSHLPYHGVPFATSNTLSPGDKVWAVGFPNAADKFISDSYLAVPTLTAGQISRVLADISIDGSKITTGLLQITAAINPGNSGGPLFNEFGEIVGINTAKSLVPTIVLKDGPGEEKFGIARVSDGEAIAWAQQVDALLPVLSSLHIEYSHRSEPHSKIAAWARRDPITAISLAVVTMITAALFALMKTKYSHIRLLDAGARSREIDRNMNRVASLIGLSGQYRGNSIPLVGTITIGRDPRRCSIVLRNEFNDISGLHCSIAFDPTIKRFELKDLDSTNGTYALGKRLLPGEVVMMKPGDKFHLANSGNRFEVVAA